VRVTMVGEPGTTVYGADGPTGGPPADPLMNPEGNLPVLLVRRQARRTVFASIHEPYDRDRPRIRAVRKVAESKDAYVAEVRADSFIDRFAVAFGEEKDTPVHALRGIRDPQEIFVFRNYGYLRETTAPGGKDPRLAARGDWIGLRMRCPGSPPQGGLILNGKSVPYSKDGEYVVFGDRTAAPSPDRLAIALEEPLPEWAVPGQEIRAAWILHNPGSAPLSDIRLRLNVPAGCGGAGEPARIEGLPAGGQGTARFSLRMPALGSADRRIIAITPEVSFRDGDGVREILGVPEEILLTPPLEITAPGEPVRLGAQDSREVALKLRNWSHVARPAWIEVTLPAGIGTEGGEERWRIASVGPGETVETRLRLRTQGKAAGGLHLARVRVTDDPAGDWSPPAPLRITVGPVLVEDNSYPTFGEYVIYAPRYTFRMSKRYGTSRFLRDDADRPRYEATFWSRRPPAETQPDALPRLQIGGEDILAWGVPAGFLWPRSAPASVSVGTRRSRITWRFEDDAIRVEPEAMWSAEAPHWFIFPGGPSGWTSWGQSPRWLRIISVDEAGEERELTEPPARDQEILIRAALLHVPGYDEAIGFAVDRPQKTRFDESSIRPTVGPGEPIWFGLCRPETFDAWRRARQRDRSDGESD